VTYKELTILHSYLFPAAVNSNKEDPTKAVIDLTTVIDFVNDSKIVEADIQFLRRRARLVHVGHFGGEIKLNLINILTRAYKLIGIENGSIIDLRADISCKQKNCQTDCFKSI
jgi:propanol-preferring alcohol dehydrogenase